MNSDNIIKFIKNNSAEKQEATIKNIMENKIEYNDKTLKDFEFLIELFKSYKIMDSDWRIGNKKDISAAKIMDNHISFVRKNIFDNKNSYNDSIAKSLHFISKIPLNSNFKKIKNNLDIYSKFIVGKKIINNSSNKKFNFLLAATQDYSEYFLDIFIKMINIQFREDFELTFAVPSWEFDSFYKFIKNKNYKNKITIYSIKPYFDFINKNSSYILRISFYHSIRWCLLPLLIGENKSNYISYIDMDISVPNHTIDKILKSDADIFLRMWGGKNEKDPMVFYIPWKRVAGNFGCLRSNEKLCFDFASHHFSCIYSIIENNQYDPYCCDQISLDYTSRNFDKRISWEYMPNSLSFVKGGAWPERSKEFRNFVNNI